ncbi:MAG: HAMP domain-containing histidine kinase [Lachnospiraceae bacterium]|nr:HAMP domain-containing histidine kinase [Lachnospiraceae bacterium]
MKRTVKWHLIQRFLIVLFCVYWGGVVIDYLYRLVLTPAVLRFFESQQIEITGTGGIFTWMIQMLFYILTEFLPPGVREWVKSRIDRAMGSSMRIEITSPLYSGVWGILLRVLITGGILVLLFVRLLPYLAGAFYYSRAVAKQFDLLLAEEKEQKLADDKKKNLLLSDIAHDIKTPITTICGYSRALSEGVVEEGKRQAYLDVIYAKALRMDELVTLLFEYVKLESEGFLLHRQQGDLAELVREMTALLYTDFEEKRMTLEMEIAEEKMPFEMDRLQLGRAVTNLLTNALRYGKEGGRVLVRLTDYELTVADEGEPIDPALADHIFEPFTRGDRARSTQGGSGLGLGIAKKIVEMHGGRLLLNLRAEGGYTKAFQMRFPDPA